MEIEDIWDLNSTNPVHELTWTMEDLFLMLLFDVHWTLSIISFHFNNHFVQCNDRSFNIITKMTEFILVTWLYYRYMYRQKFQLWRKFGQENHHPPPEEVWSDIKLLLIRRNGAWASSYFITQSIGKVVKLNLRTFT